MTKQVFQAGQFIDVVTFNGVQYVCAIALENDVQGTTIMQGDETLESATIERYLVESVIVAFINNDEFLTDENSNVFEQVVSATIVTEKRICWYKTSKKT